MLSWAFLMSTALNVTISKLDKVTLLTAEQWFLTYAYRQAR